MNVNLVESEGPQFEVPKSIAGKMTPATPPADPPKPAEEPPADPPTEDPAPPAGDPPAPGTDPVDPTDPPAGDPEPDDESVVALALSEGWLGEQVQPDTYENSIEGMRKYLADRDKARDTRVLQAFLTANPTLANFYNHVVAEGKPVETFLRRSTAPEHISMELKPVEQADNDQTKASKEETYKSIIRTDLLNKGLTSEMIDTVINTVAAQGTLYQTAVNSQKAMKASFEKELADAETAAQAARQKEILEAVNTQKAIKDIVTNNKFDGGMIVPDADKAPFIQYLTSTIDPETGETMADKKYAELSLAQKVYLDYLVYKGFKVPTTQLGAGKSQQSSFLKGKKANEGRDTIPKPGVSSANVKNLNLESIAKQSGLLFGY